MQFVFIRIPQGDEDQKHIWIKSLKRKIWTPSKHSDHFMEKFVKRPSNNFDKVNL